MSRTFSLLPALVRRTLPAVLLGTVALSASAELTPEEARHITSEYSLVLGRRDVVSTYLSPLNYHGFRPSLAGAWSKGMPFSPLKWRMRFDASLGGGQLTNTPGTAIEYTVGADFSWGMERIFRFADRFTVTAGGNVGFSADVYWLTRNSNNPVSLGLWAGLSLAGSASYSFRLGRLPVELSERVTVPTLGPFFMPGYGESFYEIYLGNTSGLVHCGWWGNAPAVRSHLELTMNFGRRSLAVGYLLDHRQFDANHLCLRQTTNALTIALRY